MAISWRPIIRCHRTKVWMILDRVLCEKQQKKYQHNFAIAAGMGTLVSAMMSSTISASGRSRIFGNDCSHQVCVHVSTTNVLAQTCFWMKYACSCPGMGTVYCKRGNQKQCIEKNQHYDGSPVNGHELIWKKWPFAWVSCTSEEQTVLIALQQRYWGQ